ncbi:MAG: MBL fold metallo-hydrolase [bacterium]
MITVKRFTFNPFQENTYVLYDESGSCIIIDPGMDGRNEQEILVSYIDEKGLKPELVVNTHMHIDHILGNYFTTSHYGIKLAAHRDSLQFMKTAPGQAQMFGIHLDDVRQVDQFLEEGSLLKFGQSSMEILHTPGHADGSLCFYAAADRFVISGDVLFNQSIGRTDLPTGNYETLQENIWKKLFTLPDDTVVYPGHGPETTIGYEKTHNPFVAIGKEK